MQSILDTVPQMAAYSPSLIAIAVLSIAILVQSFFAGILALAPGHQTAGKPLSGDNDDRSFRIMRTYANSTENLPAFIAIAAIAMIAGVDAFWANLIIGLHVAIRLAYWAIYYSGIGAAAGGPRTIFYVLGLVTNFALGVFALIALLG